MSLAIITLPTNKSTSAVSDHVRKIGQGEKGQKLDVIVTDANSSGYDLTNKIITFSENKDGGKIVSDSDSAHINVTDAAAGRFTYTLAEAVYAASGIAWFDISNKDGTVIDTTKSFNIDVIQDETIHVNNDNYVSSLAALETHYKGVIQKTEQDTAALINQLKEQVNQAVSDGNSDIQAVIDKANQLISDWKTELSSQQQKIVDLQNAWKTQTEQINADYQAQKQLIKSDADAEIAKIDTDKQTALNQCNTDFENKLASIQSDYNNWKTATIADFQKQLDKLADELQNDEKTQADLKEAIDSANKAIANISNVDFTKFAHKTDLENYYDKSTMDQKIAQAGKLKQISVNNGTPVGPDSSGTANLNIPQPDLSGYETKIDAKTAHDTLSSSIAKRILSINGVIPDDKGNLTLPDIDHPSRMYAKNEEVDIDSLTETGIYNFMDAKVIASIKTDALDGLPKTTDGSTMCGFLLVMRHDDYNREQILLLNGGPDDIVIATRSVSGTNSWRPCFRRWINIDDYNNLMSRITEVDTKELIHQCDDLATGITYSKAHPKVLVATS